MLIWSLASSTHGQSEHVSVGSRPTLGTGLLHRALHEEGTNNPNILGPELKCPCSLKGLGRSILLVYFVQGQLSHFESHWGELMRNKTFTCAVAVNPTGAIGKAGTGA